MNSKRTFNNNNDNNNETNNSNNKNEQNDNNKNNNNNNIDVTVIYQLQLNGNDRFEASKGRTK